MSKKQLTLSTLKQKHSKVFSQKKVLLDIDGKNYEVLIDNVFKTTKLQELVMELAKLKNHLTSINSVLDVISLYPFLIFKYFTNIEACKEVKSIEEMIGVYKILLDLDIAEKVLSSFDEKQLNRINEFIAKANSNIKEFQNNPELIQEYSELVNEIDDIKLENEEVFVDNEDIGDIDGM